MTSRYFYKLNCVLLLVCLAVLPVNADVRDIVTHDNYHDFAASLDAEAHEIELDKFLSLMQQDNVVVFDLRSRQQYERQHIQGAQHLGSDITAEKLQTLAPDKEATILLYCQYSFHPVRMMSLTMLSMPQLVRHGYQHVYTLKPVWMGKMDRYEEALKKLPMTPLAPVAPVEN
ncbi:MAG: rhodanese-like domain-containing protein [Vampirovibrio sp.]|nr:rhodanese-like domain-containing protein [Vampirovibrio sp.]